MNIMYKYKSDLFQFSCQFLWHRLLLFSRNPSQTLRFRSGLRGLVSIAAEPTVLSWRCPLCAWLVCFRFIAALPNKTWRRSGGASAWNVWNDPQLSEPFPALCTTQHRSCSLWVTPGNCGENRALTVVWSSLNVRWEINTSSRFAVTLAKCAIVFPPD